MEKSRTVIFDTNIWIGLLVNADSLHRKSVAMARGNALMLKIVPEYILLETLTLLKKYTTTKEVQQSLDMFLQSETVEILPAVHSYDKTIALFQTLNDKHLSFVDTSLLALSHEYEVKTFDKKLATAIKKYSI